jgi:hypothetical protein
VKQPRWVLVHPKPLVQVEERGSREGPVSVLEPDRLVDADPVLATRAKVHATPCHCLRLQLCLSITEGRVENAMERVGSKDCGFSAVLVWITRYALGYETR